MKKLLLHFFTAAFIFCSSFAFGQQTAHSDSTKNATTNENNKYAKRKDMYIVYGGVTFNQLNVDANQFESSSQVGYNLGVSYRRGGLVYWQAGLRYNSPLYHLKEKGVAQDSAESNFSVRDLDIPLNIGLNFLSFTNRFLGARVFIGIIPAFTLSTNDNHLGITKDDVNSFNTYGQVGIGGDVAFLVVDAGLNFGFSDVLKNGKSKPTQFFIDLGFRF